MVNSNYEQRDPEDFLIDPFTVRVKEVAAEYEEMSQYETVASHYYERTPSWNELDAFTQEKILDFVSIYLEDHIDQIDLNDVVMQAVNQIREQRAEDAAMGNG